MKVWIIIGIIILAVVYFICARDSAPVATGSKAVVEKVEGTVRIVTSDGRSTAQKSNGGPP